MTNPFNAGLPQRAVDYKSPIGAMMALPQLGLTVTMGDGSEWLIGGSAVSYRAKYAQAAKVDHLKTFGVASTLATPVVGQPQDPVSNGSGVILIGGSNNCNRSTDGGKTWSTINLVAQFPSRQVQFIWAGDRFIAVANSATQLLSAHSLDGGATWSAGTALTISGTADTVKIAYNKVTGSVFASWSNTAGSSMAKCTALSTFSATGPTGAMNLVDLAAGGGRVVAMFSTSTYTSIDDGATWPAYTTPSILNATTQALRYVGSVWVGNHTADGSYVYCADASAAANWVAKPFPAVQAAQAPVSTGQRFTTDGNRVYAGNSNSYYYTTDGLQWRRRWLSSVASNSGHWRVVNSGVGVFFMNGANVSLSPGLYSASIDTPDFIGCGLQVPFDSASGAPVGYYRIK